MQKISFHLAVILILVLVLLFGPFANFSDFSKIYLGGNRLDGAIYVWLVRERANDLFSMNGAMYYPYALSGAYSDNFILPAMFYKLGQFWPFSRLFKTEVLLYNCILLMPVIIAAYTMFALAKKLSKNIILALLVGALVVCLPYLIGQIGHPQLLGIFPIPLVYLCYRVFLLSRKRVEQIIFAFTLGAIVCASFYWSVYYCIFSILLLLLVILRSFVRRELSVIQLANLALANIPWMLLLVVSIQPYLAVQARFGQRSLRDVRGFSTGAMALLKPAYSNSFWGELFGVAKDFENQNFPGLVFMFLFLIALLIRVKQKSMPNGLMFLFLFLALGFDYLNMFPKEFVAYWYWLPFLLALAIFFKSKFETSEFFFSLALVFLVLSWGVESSRGFPSPFAVLFNYLPGVSSIRAPGRLIVVFYFMALSGVVVSLSPFVTQIRFKTSTIIFAALIMLASLESSARYVYAPMGEARPQIYKQLANYSKPGDVAVSLPILPKGEGPGRYTYSQTEYMLWLQNSVDRYINGYSGNASKWNTLFPFRMRYFPSEKSLAILATIPELNWIVYHPPQKQVESIEDKISEFSQLSLFLSDSTGAKLIKHRPYYANGNHRLRVAHLGRRTQKLSILLAAETNFSLEEVEIVLDCGSGGGDKTGYSGLVKSIPKLTCKFSEVEDVVSSRLFNLEIKSSNADLKLFLEEISNK